MNALIHPTAARFTVEEAEGAGKVWGANCGPGAIAGILGMTLDEVRPRANGRWHLTHVVEIAGRRSVAA